MDFLTVLTIFSVALIYTGTSKTVNVTRDKPRRLDISCKKTGGVISTIDVISGSNTKTCCVGKTPQMIVESLNCYWRSSCSISFPTDILIMPQHPDTDCEGCIGSPADNIVLKEARCFVNTTKEAIVDICDENGHLTGNISIDGGLLRSHPDYPWQYNSNSYSGFGRSQPNHVCKKKLWLSEKKTNIVMTVQVVDIAEGDFLNVTNVTMNDEVTTETITSSMTRVYEEHKSLEFTFGISQGTNGGMGFLLCFKRFQTGNYDRKMDACDELMNKEVKIKKRRVKGKCPTVWGCRSRKGSRKGRGGSGKKKGKQRRKNKSKNDKVQKDGVLEEPKNKTNSRKRSKSGRNRKRKTRS